MKSFQYLLFALLFLSNSLQGANQSELPKEPRPKTPIMGWASWNNYRVEINEDIIKAQADAMVSSGLKDAGYNLLTPTMVFMVAETRRVILWYIQNVFPTE